MKGSPVGSGNDVGLGLGADRAGGSGNDVGLCLGAEWEGRGSDVAVTVGDVFVAPAELVVAATVDGRGTDNVGGGAALSGNDVEVDLGADREGRGADVAVSVEEDVFAAPQKLLSHL